MNGEEGEPAALTSEEQRAVLRIRDLDTGEEYIIGENEPEFDFDTFSRVQEDKALAEPLAAPSETDGDPGWAAEVWKTITGWFSSDDTDARSSTSESKQSEKKDKPPVPRTASTEATAMASPRQSKPKVSMKDFKFVKELGRGAFGLVVLAESQKDGSKYAVKIISKKDLKSSRKRQAMAERDVLASMSRTHTNPFTTGLKFAFQSENNLYLGMKYFEGGDMRKLIKRFKRLPEDWVRFYVAEIIVGVAHLHSLHVLYRDLKPHNVMLDVSGHICLIDYGLAKQHVRHPRGAQTLVGTPDYSAPEVLQTGVYRMESKANTGNRRQSRDSDLSRVGYGKSADWWSVGIMMYEMIKGSPPFRGADLRETYRNILYAELRFEPADLFSEAATSLIRGLLTRDPALRLGAWDNPPHDIMQHEFFENIDWEAVARKELTPPWIPTPTDASESRYRCPHEESVILNNKNQGLFAAFGNREDRLDDWSYWDNFDGTVEHNLKAANANQLG